MTSELVIDIVGWLGAAAVLYAYFLVSTNRIKGNSLHYQFFNVLGALCLIVNTYYNHAYPSTVVNIIWIAVAIYSVASSRLKLRRAAGVRVKVRTGRRFKRRP